MADDWHPLIKLTHEANGNPKGSHIDREAFHDHESAKFCLLRPQERIYELNQLSAVIGQEGVDLRKRAQILNLRRELERTHNQLLALKR